MQTKMIKINANTYNFGIVEFVVIKYFLKKWNLSIMVLDHFLPRN